MDRELEARLEALMDTHGLASIVEALAGICAEKAAHIAASYEGPNDPQALAWDANAIRLNKVRIAPTH